MPEIMLVALAGAAGTLSRYGVDRAATHSLSPHGVVYATFAINVVGSPVLGLLLGLAPGGAVQTALGVGFRGAFTTFSTWSCIGRTLSAAPPTPTRPCSSAPR